MRHMACDVLVIGSGPAGLAAAAQARRSGAGDQEHGDVAVLIPPAPQTGAGPDRDGPCYPLEWAAMKSRIQVACSRWPSIRLPERIE